VSPFLLWTNYAHFLIALLVERPGVEQVRLPALIIAAKFEADGRDVAEGIPREEFWDDDDGQKSYDGRE